MIQNPDNKLHVYTLSVGQGDTSVIVSPAGSVILIDAVRPQKIVRLLRDLRNDEAIEHLVLTHPHSDHFSGANSVTTAFRISKAIVAPFWHEFGMGPSTYRSLMGRLEDQGTNTTFLAGYSRLYPDGALTAPDAANPEIDREAPFLELLGPTNGLVGMLEEAKVFNTNHLSIMSRLTWKGFRMISCGDAQMENWSFFDNERLLKEKCQVLRAAHHGSANGTQWERVSRLSPREVIVSSDPDSGHHLPDLTATAIFAKFDSEDGQMAVITRDSGTIHLEVSSSGRRNYQMYRDRPAQNVDLANPRVLNAAENPTDWAALLDQRVSEL